MVPSKFSRGRHANRRPINLMVPNIDRGTMTGGGADIGSTRLTVL